MRSLHGLSSRQRRANSQTGQRSGASPDAHKLAFVTDRKETAQELASGSGMLNQGIRTTELVSDELLDAVRTKGRTITIAREGSEELRYLDFITMLGG